MVEIKYLQEPGILYDMVFALKLRFNGERAYLPLRTGNLSYEEDEKFYREIMDKLSGVPDSIMPFFYYDSETDKKTAMMTYLYEYVDLTSDHALQMFYESLRDVERLKKCVYENYISSNCPDRFDFAAVSAVKKELFASQLPFDFKMYLYDFLLFGEEQIEEIISVLQKVERLCREYHERHEREIQEYIRNFNDYHLSNINNWYSQNISKDDTIFFSYCVFFKVSNAYLRYDTVWLIIHSIRVIETLFQTEINIHINLFELGNILNDEQRLKILDMLCKEKMYCAQIAKELGLKNNSTLYHLSMMEKEGLIVSERFPKDGKRVFYRINCNYINSIKNLLNAKFTGVQSSGKN